MADKANQPAATNDETTSRGNPLEQLATQARLIDRLCVHLIELGNMPSEHVHAIRVGVKQLRAWWLLTAHRIDQQTRRQYDRSLRNIGRALAGSRDARMLAKTIRRLRKAAKPKTCRALDELANLTAMQRGGEPAQLPLFAIDVDLVALAQAFSADHAAWQQVAGHADPSDADGDVGAILRHVRRSHRQCQRARKRALASGRINDMHHWRKAVKKFLYQQLVLADLGIDDTAVTRIEPAIGEIDADDLARLGKRLGRWHDIAQVGIAAKRHAEALGKKPARRIKRLVWDRQRAIVKSL